MGFFDKLKGGHRAGAKPPALSVRAKAGVIYAPVDGKTCSMAELPDPVFSSGVMGQAVGIWPSDNGIYAPVSGTLTAAMPLCELGTATDLCHKVIACLQTRRDFLSTRRAQGRRQTRFE